MTERDKSLDIAKGILILLMITGHVFLEGPVRHFIYAFHMPAFLIVTGILTARSTSNSLPASAFLKKKIRTLIIPFVFFEIIGVLTDIICHGFTLNIKGYIYNTLTQNWNNGADGFLIHTFIAQVVFFMICRLCSNDRIRILIIIFSVSLVFLLPPAIDSILRISFIYLGFLTEGYYLFPRLKYDSKMMIFCLGITAMASSFGIYYGDCFGNIRNTLIYLAGANAGAYFIIWLSRRIDSKLFAFYGKNSIILLGTHNLILLPLRTYLPNSYSLAVSLCILLLTAAAEYPIILFLNKYFPFLIGRKRSRFGK